MMTEPTIDSSVTLTAGEVRLGRFVARERRESNRFAGFPDRTHSRDMSSYEVDLVGVFGEMAFCKLFNIYWDGNGEPRLSVDDDGDCTIRAYGFDLRCDVKTTEWETGRLLLPRYTDKPAIKIYGLMTCTFPTLVYRGLMLSEDLVSCPLMDLGGSMVHAAQQSELMTVRDCIERIGIPAGVG